MTLAPGCRFLGCRSDDTPLGGTPNPLNLAAGRRTFAWLPITDMMEVPMDQPPAWGASPNRPVEELEQVPWTVLVATTDHRHGAAGRG